MGQLTQKWFSRSSALLEAVAQCMETHFGVKDCAVREVREAIEFSDPWCAFLEFGNTHQAWIELEVDGRESTHRFAEGLAKCKIDKNADEDLIDAVGESLNLFAGYARPSVSYMKADGPLGVVERESKRAERGGRVIHFAVECELGSFQIFFGFDNAAFAK